MYFIQPIQFWREKIRLFASHLNLLVCAPAV